MDVATLIAMMLSGVVADDDQRSAIRATAGCGSFQQMAYRPNPDRGTGKTWQSAPPPRKIERRRSLPCFRLAADHQN